MPFLRNSRQERSTGRWVATVFALVALAYPLIVYSLHGHVPFLAFAMGAVLLLVLRAYVMPGEIMKLLRLPLVTAAGMLAILAVIDATIAAKAYPALLSLLVALLFGNSLRRPPSLVERLARMSEPDLPPDGQAYCRAVTWIWCLWLLGNAAIAAILALSEDMALWALWTGLVSYICSGILFAGEMLLRPWIRRRMSGAAE
jgi:uncharacterized membrane protein